VSVWFTKGLKLLQFSESKARSDMHPEKIFMLCHSLHFCNRLVVAMFLRSGTSLFTMAVETSLNISTKEITEKVTQAYLFLTEVKVEKYIQCLSSLPL